jgi:hypothetical protein
MPLRGRELQIQTPTLLEVTPLAVSAFSPRTIVAGPFPSRADLAQTPSLV